MSGVVARLRETSPPQAVRTAVRELLQASGAFDQLDPPTRRELAHGLVKICTAASAFDGERGAAAVALGAAPVRAQSAGSEFSGVAASKVAETTRNILNAVSFPRFVTELINGVFKALVDTNQQQLSSYVELIRNVAATTDGFADANVGAGGARGWLAERFPETFVVEGAEDYDEPPADAEERAERAAEAAANQRLRLRPGASMPSPAALRLVLGLPEDQSAPGGDPESLVPLARMAMARNRQQMLATMVMLGLQRIVIDTGRLHASMRFHIDTRSAAQEDRGSQFDGRHSSTASGSFGYGPWGASATMTNTIGYVSTQKTQTTEEVNTDLNLDSSVELLFKTDYLPLERLAGGPQLERIKVNTLNPEAEAKAATDARSARDKAAREAEGKRSEAIGKSWSPVPATPTTPKPGEPGSPEAAEKARLDAAKEKAEGATGAPGGATTTTPTTPTATPTPITATTPATTTTPTTTPTTPGTTTTPTTPAATLRAEDAPAGREPANAEVPSGNADTKKAEPAPTTKKSEETKKPPPAQGAALAAPESRRTPDVIFVPTPPESVDTMLAMAAPRAGERLVDLGCGDGRIVVAAAERYGCRAIGYDIDPRRIAEAHQRIATAGVGALAEVHRRDLFDVELSNADVVTLYLLPQLNAKLTPQLLALRPGARVVSHDFPIEGVLPDRVVQDYLPRLNLYKTYFLFTAPLRLQRAAVRHEWAESARLAG